MAEKTNPELEQSVMYSMFIRNHTKEGTFAAAQKDLPRIKEMGFDLLWLMPIQPSGTAKRKGRDGSPYAIKDYDAIDPALGTWDDFSRFCKEARSLGLKVLVDVVFNHTSPDSRLFQEHPEWFYQTEEGIPYSLEPSWSDIIDLDYSNHGLWTRQIETLKKYAEEVDGFRCDVASRVPAAFWLKAREECEKVHPGLIWLAESCHLPFIQYVRRRGRIGESDSALFQAFDVLYDYDVFPIIEEIFHGQAPLSRWALALNEQDPRLPENFIKLRYLENHDTERAARFIARDDLWKNWTALIFVLRGLPMIYEGQEDRIARRPSIFDRDPIAWTHDDSQGLNQASGWIRQCSKLHHQLSVLSHPFYSADDRQGLMIVEREEGIGIFRLKDNGQDFLKLDVPDGFYENRLANSWLVVQDGLILAEQLPFFGRLPISTAGQR